MVFLLSAFIACKVILNWTELFFWLHWFVNVCKWCLFHMITMLARDIKYQIYQFLTARHGSWLPENVFFSQTVLWSGDWMILTWFYFQIRPRIRIWIWSHRQPSLIQMLAARPGYVCAMISTIAISCCP